MAGDSTVSRDSDRKQPYDKTTWGAALQGAFCFVNDETMNYSSTVGVTD